VKNSENSDVLKHEAEHADSAILNVSKAFQKALKAVGARMEKIEARLDAAKSATELKQHGELLKANLHLLKSGMKEIRVEDYFATPIRTVSIALDPTKDPQRNCLAYFRQARKLTRAEPKETERLAAAHKTQEALENALCALEKGELEVEAGAELLRKHGFARFLQTPHVRAKQEERRRYRRFMSADGYAIYVGKTAADNDYVTFRVGKGKDLWCHIESAPGSHVVVKIPKGKEAPQETLLDAATLAVYYSKRRGSSRAPVTHSRVCDIRKSKRAPSGQVYVPFGKTLQVRMMEGRLKRLLATGGQE